MNIDKIGICSECGVCVDVCPADAIDNFVVNHDKCVLCLNCLKNCPNESIKANNFEVNIIKGEDPLNGSIVSCLNCGLCADNSINSALKQVNGKMRYDPSCDLEVLEDLDENELDNEILDDILEDAFLDENDDMNLTRQLLKEDSKIESINQKSIDGCPVSTLNENLEEGLCLTGYCVSCGKCVKVCDIQKARNFVGVKWDGSILDGCISCGICSEVCPKDAITLKRGTIEVDTDNCILCETCGIHCPVDVIPKTTLVKKHIKNGFNLIDNKLCMNCKLCYKICPEDAIIDNKDFMAVDEDKCTYCGGCRNACPAEAFIFEREFEDATNTIDSTVKDVTDNN
jgi:energy-converting hydrogenase B subunit K